MGKEILCYGYQKKFFRLVIEFTISPLSFNKKNSKGLYHLSWFIPSFFTTDTLKTANHNIRSPKLLDSPVIL